MSSERKIESRFETIFNHVNEGILIAGADGHIILTNPRLDEMFGYPEGELKSKPLEILIPSEMAHRHVDYRDTYMKHPVRRSMGKNLMLHGLKRDGNQFPLEISLSYYETGDGLYVIAFVIDITERYLQQEKIHRMNVELKTLAESLERKVNERTLVIKEALNGLEHSRDELSKALEKEKELNEMKSRFISMASHEFRTPLSTILSSVSLIGKYTTSEDQDKREKHVGRIKNAVSGLTEILNDFLSLGKLEEGKLEAKEDVLDVCAAVQEVISDVSTLCKEGQEIKFNGHHECLTIADKQMLRNVMLNLLSNAIKFSPENSTIEVTGKHMGEVIEIAVKDYGIGISEEDQKNLFERFFRGRNASNIQGTGLGLNIVLRYLELMKGSITFESRINEGTTFYLKLPVKKATI
jgi:PAS domain S-box-containing protein